MQDATSMFELQLVVLTYGYHRQKSGESTFLILLHVMQACMNQIRVLSINRIFRVGKEGMELIAIDALAIERSVAIGKRPYSLLVAENANRVTLIPKHFLSICQMGASRGDIKML